MNRKSTKYIIYALTALSIIAFVINIASLDYPSGNYFHGVEASFWSKTVGVLMVCISVALSVGVIGVFLYILISGNEEKSMLFFVLVGALVLYKLFLSFFVDLWSGFFITDIREFLYVVSAVIERMNGTSDLLPRAMVNRSDLGMYPYLVTYDWIPLVITFFGLYMKRFYSESLIIATIIGLVVSHVVILRLNYIALHPEDFTLIFRQVEPYFTNEMLYGALSLEFILVAYAIYNRFIEVKPKKIFKNKHKRTTLDLSQ